MEITGAGVAGRYPFAKLHGLGNDFVFFDDRDEAMDVSVDQVKRLCDRRFGIGADGVILVRPARLEGCDGLMYYINADGTLAQMCGNGVRCFAKYVVDRGIVDAARGSLTVETLAGPRAIRFTMDEAGRRGRRGHGGGAGRAGGAPVRRAGAFFRHDTDAGLPHWPLVRLRRRVHGQPPCRVPHRRLGGTARPSVQGRREVAGHLRRGRRGRLLREPSRLPREDQRGIRLRG